VLQGLQTSREAKYQGGIGWAQRVLGQVTQAEGALAEAGRCLTTALSLFAAMPARFEVARTYLALGELAQRQGNRTSRTKSHKPLNLLTFLFLGYIVLKNN
jgi:hypothetical protein